MDQRVEALERTVAELQRLMASATASPNWIERFTGAFENEPAFAEVVEYGRAFRAASDVSPL
jgi:hypothetical protein